MIDESGGGVSSIQGAKYPRSRLLFIWGPWRIQGIFSSNFDCRPETKYWINPEMTRI